jgi:glycosyltransferase involved in cell wall biosynthesis
MLENISEEYMTKLYNDCEMFVLLSQNESTAIALLDALAMHKPAISTKRGGLADYVRKGYCIGVDWPPDPATVAFEMAKLLRNLKEHVPVNFKAYSWDDVTLKLLSLYKCVLSEDSD